MLLLSWQLLGILLMPLMFAAIFDIFRRSEDDEEKNAPKEKIAAKSVRDTSPRNGVKQSLNSSKHLEEMRKMHLEADRLRVEARAYVDKICHLDSEFHRLTGELKAQNEAVNQRDLEIGSLREQLRVVSGELAAKNICAADERATVPRDTMVQSLERNLKARHLRIVELQNELKNMQELLAPQLAAANEKIASLEQAVAVREQAFTVLQREMSALRRRLDVMEGVASEDDSALLNLEEELTSSPQDVLSEGFDVAPTADLPDVDSLANIAGTTETPMLFDETSAPANSEEIAARSEDILEEDAESRVAERLPEDDVASMTYKSVVGSNDSEETPETPDDLAEVGNLPEFTEVADEAEISEDRTNDVEEKAELLPSNITTDSDETDEDFSGESVAGESSDLFDEDSRDVRLSPEEDTATTAVESEELELAADESLEEEEEESFDEPSSDEKITSEIGHFAHANDETLADDVSENRSVAELEGEEHSDSEVLKNFVAQEAQAAELTADFSPENRESASVEADILPAADDESVLSPEDEEFSAESPSVEYDAVTDSRSEDEEIVASSPVFDEAEETPSFVANVENDLPSEQEEIEPLSSLLTEDEAVQLSEETDDNSSAHATAENSESELAETAQVADWSEQDDAETSGEEKHSSETESVEQDTADSVNVADDFAEVSDDESLQVPIYAEAEIETEAFEKVSIVDSPEETGSPSNDFSFDAEPRSEHTTMPDVSPDSEDEDFDVIDFSESQIQLTVDEDESGDSGEISANEDLSAAIDGADEVSEKTDTENPAEEGDEIEANVTDETVDNTESVASLVMTEAQTAEEQPNDKPDNKSSAEKTTVSRKSGVEIEHDLGNRSALEFVGQLSRLKKGLLGKTKKTHKPSQS